MTYILFISEVFIKLACTGIRLDFLGTLLTFVVAILTVASRFTISPSQTGVTLSYILLVQQAFGWAVRQSAEVENNMNVRVSSFIRNSFHGRPTRASSVSSITRKRLHRMQTTNVRRPNHPLIGQLKEQSNSKMSK